MRLESELLLLGFAERDLSKVTGLVRTLALSAPNSRKGSYEELVNRLTHEIQALNSAREELEDDPGTDC